MWESSLEARDTEVQINMGAFDLEYTRDEAERCGCRAYLASTCRCEQGCRDSIAGSEGGKIVVTQ